jgi:hypothetical protein
MSRSANSWKRALPALLLVVGLFFVCGCATTQVQIEGLPPVLTQDELLRHYHKVASIEVSRERYGSPADLNSADYSWAYHALQREAAKIGADAVILPEVKVELENYIFFPTSEINVKGVAIKFE